MLKRIKLYVNKQIIRINAQLRRGLGIPNIPDVTVYQVIHKNTLYLAFGTLPNYFKEKEIQKIRKDTWADYKINSLVRFPEKCYLEVVPFDRENRIAKVIGVKEQ